MRPAFRIYGWNNSGTNLADEFASGHPFPIANGSPDPEANFWQGISLPGLPEAFRLFNKARKLSITNTGSITAHRSDTSDDRSISWDLTDLVAEHSAVDEARFLDSDNYYLVNTPIGSMVDESWASPASTPIHYGNTDPFYLWNYDESAPPIWYKDMSENLFYVPPFVFGFQLGVSVIALPGDQVDLVVMPGSPDVDLPLLVNGSIDGTDFVMKAKITTSLGIVGESIVVTDHDFGTVTITTSEYWEYRDGAGLNPIWDITTGAQLIDPLPRDLSV